MVCLHDPCFRRHHAILHDVNQAFPPALQRQHRRSASSSLSAAETACCANSQCIGVYDSGCDNSGNFYQCDSAALQTSSSSCVYTKA